MVEGVGEKKIEGGEKKSKNDTGWPEKVWLASRTFYSLV